MEVQLSPEQSKVINRIAEEEGFKDFDITTSPGSAKGDNYLGIITRVSVKNGRKKLELILKWASRDEKLREIAPTRNSFVREVDMYETVFPAFAKFLIDEGCNDLFTAHPKSYGSSTKEFDEFILLENLKEIGYDLWDRNTPMNWDHIELVLKEYGKFHAISLAMREKDPGLFTSLTKDFKSTFNGDDEAKDEKTKEEEKIKDEKDTMIGLSNGIKAVKGNVKAEEAMQRFSNTVMYFFNEEIQVPEDKLVLVHGDCWCNNFLFKYEDPTTKKPSKVCLIDWQLSEVGSPAIDLSYFLFTCAPKEILANYEKCLRIYHDAASETLRNVGCDPEVIYPFGLLEKHWRKYARWGLYLEIVVLKLMLSGSDEVPDLTEAAKAGKSFMEGMTENSVNNEAYNQRVLDAVLICTDNGWL